MATNAEILDLGMSRLGQRSSTRVRADLLLEINNSIETLERGTFLPWFLESVTSLSVVTDDTSAALSANFLREVEDTRPYYTLSGTVYYLEKRLYGVLVGEAPTGVDLYAIRGTTFHFRKAADQAYTINVLTYNKSNDPLVDNATAASNVWLLNAQDWILYHALVKVAALHVGFQEGGTNFADLANGAKIDLYNYHESRTHTNQDYFVGGASDGS